MVQVITAVAAKRQGTALMFSDADGLRHAVRTSAILAASDADDARDATVIQLPGGRFVIVRTPLEEVTAWISAAQPPSRPSSKALDEEVRRARVVVANLRSVWLRTMSALIEEGLLTSSTFRVIREQCLEAAVAFGGSGGEDHRAVGAEGARDLSELFAQLLPAEGGRA